MRRIGWAALAVLVLAGVMVIARPAPAWADSGPELRVPREALRQSLHCSYNVDDDHDAPVLLIPGTTVTPRENFSWNFERAFHADQRSYCTVTLPNNAMSDVQVSAEYVVHAIRTMRRIADRKIDVIGHSQGGMIGRWALKYWPDTRDDVDDLIGIAPSNHGTATAVPLCAAPGGCAPAFWQQRAGSDFITALNAGRETYDEVDYTVIYSQFDEVVTPAPSAELRGGGDNVRNVPVQRICPGYPTEHLTVGTTDPVAYALAIDALDHDGPADPARISRSVCTKALQPGVNPVSLPGDLLSAGAVLATTTLTYPHVREEPPLADYARDES
jgi:pimeloyl-ACP methyl ester carboxylesterase